MADDVVKLGLLGCGAIAQFAHIPAALRAKRARLGAICDAADDLLEAVGRRAGVTRLYTRFDEMLADRGIAGVIIAAPDPFHVPLAVQALRAGKHVLVEKPMGASSQECLQLLEVQRQTGLKLQVGSMKRHDPGVAFAHAFARESIGDVLSVSAVYRDTVFRPAMQETCLDPLLTSSKSVKPAADPKADREQYNLWTQGAHLFDNIRYLAGPVSAVTAQVARQHGQFSWHGILELAGGGRGHFELTCKACGDWLERYEVFGERGSIEVRVPLPFYNRPAQARCFDGLSREYSAPLGEHSHAYANQLDAFAAAILHDLPTVPDAREGLAAVRLLEAVSASASGSGGRRVEIEQATETGA